MHVWNQPYLETCCRSALHRLTLAGLSGRPPGTKDTACLERLATLGLATRHPGGRWTMTETGRHRHATEVAPGS